MEQVQNFDSLLSTRADDNFPLEAGQKLGGYEFALVALKHGYKVQRTGWNGKGMYVELQRPDEHSKMSLPYIFMKTADDKFVPWLCSQTDALADDWQVFVLSEGELRG